MTRDGFMPHLSTVLQLAEAGGSAFMEMELERTVTCANYMHLRSHTTRPGLKALLSSFANSNSPILGRSQLLLY